MITTNFSALKRPTGLENFLPRTNLRKFIKTLDNDKDKDLISLWQKGSESAFNIFYQKYAVELVTIAMQKTNDREVATELVQSVFITLFNRKDSAHSIEAPFAYLYTALKNRILDHHRHLLIQKKYMDYAMHQAETIPANEVTMYIETKELERVLRREIRKLPRQCQTVFTLKREQELSNKEIARHLSISENTVEQHMRKALKILKNALLNKHYFRQIHWIFLALSLI